MKNLIATGQRLAISASLAVVTAAVCRNQSLAQQPAQKTAVPIKIAFVTSLTGVAAEPAKEMLNGFNLYLDHIGHKMAGRNVELLVENDESNPATAKQKVKNAVELDHADVISGFLLTNVGYAAAPLADKYKIPMVVSVSAADDLTQRQQYDWIIRTGFNCSGSTMPFGDYVFKKLGYKKIAMFGMDYPYGYEIAGGFHKTYELAGGRIIQKIWAPLGFQDFSTYIKQISKNADAVFVNTSSHAANVFPSQYLRVGPKLPIVASGSSYDEHVLRHLGDESIGVLSVQNYSAQLNTPENKSFVKAYQAKYGYDPGMYSESAWTSGMFIAAAVEAVKGNIEDKPKFMAALKKVSIADAPRGPVKLDEHGQAIQNYYVRKVEKNNGKLVNTVVYTFPAVSQFWHFKPADFLQQPPFSKDYPVCKFCTGGSSL